MAFDLDEVKREFALLKQDNLNRNHEYFLERQAVKGNFEWPRNWPAHIDPVVHNMCKPVVERMSNYLMGKGFDWNVNRPNSLEYRDAAERTEKVLAAILNLSKADIQFMEGAKTGSKLGRTVFKVYKRGEKGSEHACFSYCQPDYFYGVPVGAENPGEFSIVYYSYPIDIEEAKRRFGKNLSYKTERDIAEADRYDNKRENTTFTAESARRIPVLEVWTKDSYLLSAGGNVVYNGDNPFKWSKTDEGFIPFVAIENIRQDEEGYGESDIAQARVLNNKLNWLVSRRDHVVNRWLNPTVVWEGAPQNYAEILAQSIGGGGAIPTRLGSKIGFLAYDNPNQLVDTHMATLVQAILEVAGMNEAAYQGVVQGSINTGPALEVQFQPLLSTIEKKRLEWTTGLKSLFAMLLEVQEGIGDSKALGEAVVGQDNKSQNAMPATPDQAGARPSDGQLVALSGADIKGLRDVSIFWSGVLPKDDFAAANLEVTKLERGLQSVYSTMEKLGEEYPNDEIDRIRRENTDPSLRGEKVAEQLRAATPLLKQQQDQQFQMGQQAMDQMAQQQGGAPAGPPPQAPPAMPQGPPPDAVAAQQGDIGARMREMARKNAPQLDTAGDFPAIGPSAGSGGGGY